MNSQINHIKQKVGFYNVEASKQLGVPLPSIRNKDDKHVMNVISS
jgi:hypothetical protein